MPSRKNPADKVQSRGAKRMRELGMKRVTLWFDPREYDLVERAARRVRKKVARWIRELAYQTAEHTHRTDRRRAIREDGEC